MKRKKLLFLSVAIVFFATSFVVCAFDIGFHGDGGLPVVVSTAHASSSPTQRNRVWRLFNNSCHTPRGMSPTATVLERNICLVVHRRTSRANRRRALLALRRIDAVRFYDFQTKMLLNALERRRPDFFISATRLVTAPTPDGRFLLELISDRERVVLVLSGQRVPLE